MATLDLTANETFGVQIWIQQNILGLDIFSPLVNSCPKEAKHALKKFVRRFKIVMDASAEFSRRLSGFVLNKNIIIVFLNHFVVWIVFGTIIKKCYLQYNLLSSQCICFNFIIYSVFGTV